MPTIEKVKKENGVVYTPDWIVKEILDKANFVRNIYIKRVIEPGCGDGAFLVQIVERIILDAKKHFISNKKIATLLNNNVFGLDIDKKAINKCKLRLDLVCEKYGIPFPVWTNIQVANILSKELMKEYLGQFDFVFGNPPYVRIQNLSKSARAFVNSNLKLCEHGSTDLYIAFFELGFMFLNETGILGYITPSSFLNSAAGKSLRSFLFDRKRVEILVDFEHHQVFENATTYSLITIVNNNINTRDVKLYKGNSSTIDASSIDLSLESFRNDNWILADIETLIKINEIKKRGTPLGKLAKIHTGLATLKDDVFIIADPTFDKNKEIATFIIESEDKDIPPKSVKIEAKILKKIIKASTWKFSTEDQHRFIIFPYKKDADNKHKIIPEKELKQDYPLAFAYFKSVRKELDTRDKGDSAKLEKYAAWYAFGRSQGIDTSFGKKIITAGINLEPRFIVCEEEDTTYYAGYSIHCDVDLYKLANELNSSDMNLFIKHTSGNYSGGYKSYSKSAIEDFGVEFIKS
jgi:adenine-specific DNA-methyltransferase